MLYFDTDQEAVFVNKPRTSRWESFVPARDVKPGDAGYLLWGEYYTYDSNGRDEGTSYQVLDLYTTQAEAEAAAEHVMRLVRDDPTLKRDEYRVADALGRPVLYVSFAGWGSGLERLVMKRVEVQLGEDPSEYREWTRW